MIEIIDNSAQFVSTLACCGVSAALYFKRRGAEPRPVKEVNVV